MRLKRPRPGNPSLRLQAEPVPEPLWGMSAYRLLGRGAAWKRIRTAQLRLAGDNCSICETGGQRLQCNEKWSYDDGTSVATLIGFEMLCPGCHNAIHIGHARLHGHWETALTHLCRVNGMTRKEGEALAREALTIWQERSQKKWTLAISNPLLKLYPQLRILIGNRVAPAERDTPHGPVQLGLVQSSEDKVQH